MSLLGVCPINVSKTGQIKVTWLVATKFRVNKFELRGYSIGKLSSFNLFIVDSATDNLSATILPGGGGGGVN